MKKRSIIALAILILFTTISSKQKIVILKQFAREVLKKWSRQIPNLTRLEAGHLAKPQSSFGGCNLDASLS